MKENKSSAPKMLNRNWVLKRKRRKLPFGLDQSSGKEQSNSKEENSLTSESSRNASAKRVLKTEVPTDQISSKKKGNDGEAVQFKRDSVIPLLNVTAAPSFRSEYS